MPKKISKSSRNKAFGTIIVGVFLFSTVISMFIFPRPEEVAAVRTPFIRVKDGNFEFLDSKGYNFKFNLDINNIKLVESRQEVGLTNIVVESDNPFGNTSLIFDKFDNGQVKFSINHQGNLYRDYSVKITVLERDVQLFDNYNQLRWDSGYFDYSDMKEIPEGNFWNTRDSNNYHTFWVRFDDTVDFYIDPLLSPQISLDFPTIEENANKTDQFTSAFTPLFDDDSLTEITYGFNERTDYFNWTTRIRAAGSVDEGVFWLGRMKNETDDGFQGGTVSIDSTQAYYGQYEGDRLLANNMIQDNVSETPYGTNLSVMQFFTYPMEHQWNFSQVRLYFDIDDHAFKDPGFGSGWYFNYDYPVNVTSDHILVAELVDNGIGSTTGNTYPYWEETGTDFDPTSSTWATEAQEHWNFPVVANLNATTAFTGTETVDSEIEIDITDLVNYWNENITFAEHRLGIRLRITKLGDPTNSSWLFIDDYGIEWTFLVPNVLSGVSNPYWLEVGETRYAEFDRFENHFEWENGKYYPEQKGAFHPLGGKNFKGRAMNLAENTYQMWANLTTEGVNCSLEKISATQPGWSFGYWLFQMTPDTNPYVIGGEYRVRFRGEDNWDGLGNNYLDIDVHGGTSGTSPSWGFAGASQAAVLDGEWHEVVYQLTQQSDFSDPYEVLHLLGYLDGELIVSYDVSDLMDISQYQEDNWLTFMRQGAFSVQFGNGGDNQGGGDNGDSAWLELDYMSFTPYLDYRLSNDSTTGSTSVESYSYSPASYSQNETFLRLAQDLFDDSYADHNIELYLPLDDFDDTFMATPSYTHDPYWSINSIDYDVTDWVQSGILAAADFEDTNSDYINFSDSDRYTFNSAGQDQAFSGSAWIKLETNDTVKTIVAKGDDNAINGEYEWWFGVYNLQLGVILQQSTGDYLFIRTDGSMLLFQDEATSWHHVAFSYNGNETVEGVSLFVDGTSYSTTTNTYGTYTGMSNTATQLRIGHDINLGSYVSGFDGLIDHVEIFRQELTASEVLTLNNSPLYNSVGFTNQDLTIDTTRMYNVDANGVYTEGHELMRLAFGNHFRRPDQVPVRANLYPYQSEGINLVNNPIMTFDMKVNFESDYGNLGNINDSFSNAYITLYNESMYPIANSSWYKAVWESANDPLIIQQDLGFTVVEDQWVSIRLDLRSVIHDGLTDTSYLQANTPSVLARLGGIGFSFYWNNTAQSYYANPTDIYGDRLKYNLSRLEYSVKIDNLQFVPIQTAGSHDQEIVGMDNPLGWFGTGLTESVETEFVKEGNQSIRYIASEEAGEYAVTARLFQNPNTNIVNNDFWDSDYMLFWIMSRNGSLGFTVEDSQSRDMYIRVWDTVESVEYYLHSTFPFNYGELASKSTIQGTLFMEENKWYLHAIPLKQFNFEPWSGTRSNPISDKIRMVQWRFFSQRQLDVIIDGLAFVDGNWDYSNLTLSDYNSNWNQTYLINSTNYNYNDGQNAYWDWAESRSGADIHLNHTIDPFDLNENGTTHDPGQWNELSYFPEWDYIANEEGLDVALGYPVDFNNNSGETWYWNNETINTTTIGDFRFGSNVNVSITENNTLLLDVITESQSDIWQTTWFKTDFNNTQIDWFYWNVMVFKIKNLNTAGDWNEQELSFGIQSDDGNRLETHVPAVGWAYTFKTGSPRIDSETTEPGARWMDNTTVAFSWHQSGLYSAASDLEIDWIRLYHVEGRHFGGLANIMTSSPAQHLFGGSPTEPMHTHHLSYNSTETLFGDESIQMMVDQGQRGTTAFGRDSAFDWYQGENPTGGFNEYYYDGTGQSWYSGGYQSALIDWTDYTAWEFWMKVDEPLNGSGDDSIFIAGQMSAEISSWGYYWQTGQDWSLNWGNITWDNIVNPINPLGYYNGTLMPNYWYHFILPFDNADWEYRPEYIDLSQVNRIEIEIYDGQDGYPTEFTTREGDGNYTIWLDGLRPINQTYNLLNTNNFYNTTDSTYVLTTIPNGYTGGFNFSSNAEVLMNHELKYYLERNPTVSSYTGYLTNGSNQVVYELNYTIQQQNDTYLFDYVHKFYYPKSYSFYNVTFGNGTVKTIQSGFTITSFNSTHYLVAVTAWENGTWEWNFITENSVSYLNISPRIEDGLQYNTTEIYYNMSLMNGSTALVGYPVTIEVKSPEDVVLTTDTKTSGVGGWVNSSITGTWDMQTDKEIYVSVRCTNQSFLGYEIEYLLSYQDFDAPTITAIEFDESTAPNLPKGFFVWVADTWTVTADLVVIMDYSFISSGSLTQSTAGSLSAGRFVISVAGQAEDTTIWFRFTVTDNMSNSFTTSVYEAVWEEPSVPSGDGDGDGDGAPPSPGIAPARGAIGTEWLILLFALGAVFAAIIVIGIYRRVVVRTRRVEEREVITVFGRTGQAKEKVEEKRG